jgi:hypothetical protein
VKQYFHSAIFCKTHNHLQILSHDSRFLRSYEMPDSSKMTGSVIIFCEQAMSHRERGRLLIWYWHLSTKQTHQWKWTNETW